MNEEMFFEDVSEDMHQCPLCKVPLLWQEAEDVGACPKCYKAWELKPYEETLKEERK